MSSEDRSAKQKSDAIERQLKLDGKGMEREIKILLLGTGESGKSTVVKQMKRMHEGEYSQRERENFKDAVFANTVQPMQDILQALETLNIGLGGLESGKHAGIIKAQPATIESDRLSLEVADAIAALWKNEAVQECYKRSNEYQLNDSAKYFFDNVDRIASPSYIPTDDDILHARVKTTGATEVRFTVNNMIFRVVDVGGQRSERKKWIHCFENVDTIMFLIAISEYDQRLFEDPTVNRMVEALNMFESICNSKWFSRTSIILFLNKTDLFKEKIAKSPMYNIFPDYQGGEDYDAACDYLLGRFMKFSQRRSKQIYPHFTCATDSTQIRSVLATVNEIIIESSLREAGLL